MKKLLIRNFGPIREAEIELKRVNLIIGPQSSGKSTVLKIACFCDWMERQIELTQNPDKFCEYSTFVSNLVDFHKLHGYIQPDSEIHHTDLYIEEPEAHLTYEKCTRCLHYNHF